jgi:hypothetical protein
MSLMRLFGNDGPAPDVSLMKILSILLTLLLMAYALGGCNSGQAPITPALVAGD